MKISVLFRSAATCWAISCFSCLLAFASVQTVYGFQGGGKGGSKGGFSSGSAVVPPSSQSLIPKNIADFNCIVQMDYYPKALRKKESHDFYETSLKDVAKWIQEKSGMTVFLDLATLEEKSILGSLPVTEDLKKVPLFLFLDRMSKYGVGWYIEEDVIVMTSLDAASKYRFNVPYNVGDLFDKNVDGSTLVDCLLLGIGAKGKNKKSQQLYAEVNGIGDILFLKTTYRGHLRAQAFLKAIRGNSKRSMVFEPDEDRVIRQKLTQRYSVEVKDRSLPDFCRNVQQVTGLTVRLDNKTISKSGIQIHRSFRIKLDQKPLRFILSSGLSRLGLVWMIKDGAIWITTPSAPKSEKTAVFSIGDLTEDLNAANLLMDAICKQSAVDRNSESIAVLSHTQLVLRSTESKISEVNQLIENYRIAIKNSKNRRKVMPVVDKVVVCYYRMPTKMAGEMKAYLMQNYQKELWGNFLEKNKDGKPTGKKATIFQITSIPGIPAQDEDYDEEGPGSYPTRETISYSTLIVTHKASHQREISEIIDKIKNGFDQSSGFGGQGSGFGGQGGGFGSGGGGFGGGGVFRVQSRR